MTLNTGCAHQVYAVEPACHRRLTIKISVGTG